MAKTGDSRDSISSKKTTRISVGGYKELKGIEVPELVFRNDVPDENNLL